MSERAVLEESVKFSVELSGSSMKALLTHCCCIVGPETQRLQLQPV